VNIADARPNCDAGNLTSAMRDAISAAAREVIAGQHDAEFPVDVFQGGAGTSTNMNMNEVLAKRAREILGGSRGAGRLVHANDDVNRSQSTNDAYATAVRISVIPASRQLQKAMTYWSSGAGSSRPRSSSTVRAPG